jgi:hypothetical protein
VRKQKKMRMRFHWTNGIAVLYNINMVKTLFLIMKRLLLTTSLAATVLILHSTPCSAEWWITTVDSNAYTDSGADVCLDSSGHPRIVYGYGSGKQGHIRYGTWHPMDSTWTSEYVGPWSGHPKMVFDSRWSPHIVWNSSYGYKDSAGWQREEKPWNGLTSLAINERDFLHVAYMQWFPDTVLYHAFLDSSGWRLGEDTVETFYPHYTTCSKVSIAVSDSCVHVVYGRWAGIIGKSPLMWARKVNGVWQKEFVDTSSGSYPRFTDRVFTHGLALDTCNAPCIAYARTWKDGSNHNQFFELKYARRIEAGWEITVVDGIPCTGAGDILSVSLSIDNDNLPHIAYYAAFQTKYAWFDGSSWNTTMLDPEGMQTWAPPIGITTDTSKCVHIAYQSKLFSESVMKYARGKGFVGVTEKRCRVQGAGRKLQVHPNPFVGFAEVIADVGTQGIVSLRIYDTSGRLIEETESGVVGTTLPPGIYFVKARGCGTARITKVGRAR